MNYLKEFARYRFLLSELVKKGIRLKYRRSYLGIIWSLIEPLLNTIVLVIVFGSLGRIKARDFPLYIVAGRVVYSFFKNATTAASLVVLPDGNAVKPSTVLFNVFTVLFNLLNIYISNGYKLITNYLKIYILGGILLWN